MAVYRERTSELPPDAIRLTQDQVLTYQYKLIDGWDNKSDTWAFTFTPPILGAMSAATGVYINNYYRTKLKLGNFGRLSSYLPIVVLPAFASVLFHKGSVQKDILMDKSDTCSTCLQVRAASFQAALGVVYPTLLAPLASFMFATRHFTYRLPSMTESPMELLQLWRKMTKPVVSTIGLGIAVHAFIAMFLTFKESENFYVVQTKILEFERNAEANETL